MDGITHVLPPEAKLKQLEQDLEQARLTNHVIIEFQKIYAQQTRAKFLALLDAGFTRQEAMALCK